MQRGPEGADLSSSPDLARRLPPTLVVAATAVLACGILISRRIGAFTQPQFYAEDGAKWFAEAYTHGPLGALGIAYNGYLQTLSHLAPVVAAPFGVQNAPLIYNISGLLVQVAPVAYFLSRRFETLVPSFWVRLAISGVYLLMPSTELNVDITNAQFHLAILATLVVIAPESKRWYSTAFDMGVVGLCGISGTFVYVLLPAAVLWLVLRRKSFTAMLCGILAAALAVQVFVSTISARAHYGLGASLHNLVLIVCDRIILAGLFAEEGHTHVFVADAPHAALFAGLICLAALAVAIYAALRAPWELRIFGLVSLGLVAGGLLEPLVSAAGHQWTLMVISSAGERYFFMAQVAWVVTLLWATSRIPRGRMVQATWVALAVAFASGLVAAWEYPPFVNYDWPREARAITTAAPGTREVLPIPPGSPWAIRVTVR